MTEEQLAGTLQEAEGRKALQFQQLPERMLKQKISRAGLMERKTASVATWGTVVAAGSRG